MYKLADISAFESLQGRDGQSGLSVFNDDYTLSGSDVDDNSLIGMSDLSDNIYEYLRDAAIALVDKLWGEYQRPNISPAQLAVLLARNVGAKFKECGDVFGRSMFEHALSIEHEYMPIGKGFKVNWDTSVNGIPTISPIFEDDE